MNEKRKLQFSQNAGKSQQQQSLKNTTAKPKLSFKVIFPKVEFSENYIVLYPPMGKAQAGKSKLKNKLLKPIGIDNLKSAGNKGKNYGCQSF